MGTTATTSDPVSELDRIVDELLAQNPEAIRKADEIMAFDGAAKHTITPAIAAAIYRRHNGHNRDLKLTKAKAYAGAMRRGEWKLNHQGLASYDDSNLGDGQHRVVAIILCDTEQEFYVTRITKEAVKTIDVAKSRNAGDALKLDGIDDPALKGSNGKAVMLYHLEQTLGARPANPSLVQVVDWVKSNDNFLSQGLTIARQVCSNISDPCMRVNDAHKIASLMLIGGYTYMQVASFMAAVQQGVATHEGAPTAVLNKIFYKALVSQKKGDKVTGTVKLALAAKAACLWGKDLTCNKLGFNPKKETLPSFAPAKPDDEN